MENRKFTSGLVREFDRKVAEETRTVEFVISDATRDRHRTVIPVESWSLDNFNNNGIVGYQHEVHGSMFSDSDPDKVLGTGEAFIEDGRLIGRVKFEPKEINPLAEKIFQKVLHGTLKATSVGFIETQKGDWGTGDEARSGANPTYYFKGVELLEFSIVNIPSNPNALRRSIEEEHEITELKNTNEQLTARNAELETQIVTLKQNLRLANKKLKGLSRSK